VLACTHFPLIEDRLAAVAPGIAFVDGGEGIARRIAHLTAGQRWPNQPVRRVIHNGGDAAIDAVWPHFAALDFSQRDKL
jgi:glutamate racemase